MSKCVLGVDKSDLEMGVRGERAPATCSPYRGVAALGETLSVAHLRVCSQQMGHLANPPGSWERPLEVLPVGTLPLASIAMMRQSFASRAGVPSSFFSGSLDG